MCPIDCSQRRETTGDTEDIPWLEDPLHTTVEFVQRERFADGKPVRIALAMNEWALADLVGLPQLLQTIRCSDGTTEFRYRLSGPLCNHVDVATDRSSPAVAE